MPKRSNEFQRLIKRIYDQLAPTGATVRESVELTEEGSTCRREVDILIEFRIADSEVRLAVECRGSGKSEDITWIDELVGKYEHLAVDKVIAVSKAGFSRCAV